MVDDRYNLKNLFNIYIQTEKETNTIIFESYVINQTGVIDEVEKIHLLSINKVSIGTPQDKTLRKLYMYTASNPEDLDLFIKILKKVNYTAAWGQTKPQKNVNIQDWINRLSYFKLK